MCPARHDAYVIGGKIMENVLDLIYSHQRVRDFGDAPVNDDQLEAMLQAAMAAPSGEPAEPPIIISCPVTILAPQMTA